MHVLVELTDGEQIILCQTLVKTTGFQLLVMPAN